MREPAKTPHAAQQRYVRFLQKSLSCLTDAIWYVAPTEDDDRALLASADPVALPRQHGFARLLFSPSQRFRLIPDERYEGEFKASTLAYIYAVSLDGEDGELEEIFAWHWHPLTTPDRPEPHAHVRTTEPAALGLTLRKLHLPTGRVSFEEVVMFLVRDLRVVPTRQDWEEVIRESYERFREFKTWG